jgi:transposase
MGEKEIKCNWCGATNFRKLRIRSTKWINNQIYKCNVCKHEFAVPIIEPPKEKLTCPEKQIYSQNWPAYNEAQMNEKQFFLEILAELISFIEEKPKCGAGRPSKSLREMIFCACLREYSHLSSRRAVSDIKVVNEKGYVFHAPNFNTILKFLDKAEVTPLLKQLIHISALPLKQVESDFAVDSTGFSTSIFSRWFDHRFGIDKTEKIWVKCHAMCGTKTNIITSVEITNQHVGDAPMFEPLVKQTSERFSIKEVSADKAYSSRVNLQLVVDIGGLPYIPFRSNATGKARGSRVWSNMYNYFFLYCEEFNQHYHKRSNIETCFHMVKSKFSNRLRAKKPTAQKNELLCRILAHNICVLIQEMFNLGLETNFYAKAPSAYKLVNQA